MPLPAAPIKQDFELKLEEISKQAWEEKKRKEKDKVSTKEEDPLDIEELLR